MRQLRKHELQTAPTLNPEFDRIQQTFLEASAIAEPAARLAFLENACEGDPELLRQVEALLFSHENAGEFLKRSAVPSPAESLTEAPGMTIGRYKLLQQIGEGGFGIVFMAEQLEPVQRKVALKVLKPGMDTREVIARFEAERQALALMDHPNVARVLDGGKTPAGRPYFVMDLVKGIPITEFCDQNQLTPKDRLNLFTQVCAGIQHAHQKGIIHRDLKPTNVLVSIQEGQPIPKVIDFGIAKAIGDKLTERTLFTRFEQLIGTPAYMSPEQAQWSGVDVDTRSDIYSLGVLLYELLTGTTPFEKETLAQAALEEVRRTIREVDPPAPSTRLHGLGQRLDQIARYRQTEPTQLARLVRGELDWIVMRALEKDRGRRYENVTALARDIQRHLSDEPVSAGPPSKLYLAAKFIRRHRLAVGSAAGVAAALVLGLGLALFEYNKARQESRRAKAEAESAEALSAFMREEILVLARPYFNPTNRNITLREVLDLAAPKIDERFSRQPLVAASLHRNIGVTYESLGESEKAEQHLRKAVALYLANRQTLPVEDLLRTEQSLGDLLCIQRGKQDEAEKILENVAYESAHALGTNHWLTLETEAALAFVYSITGRGYLAENMYRSVLEKQRRNGGEESDDALHTANSLALLDFAQGRYEEASELLETVLAALRKRRDALGREDTLQTLWNLGRVHFSCGDYVKAADLLRTCAEHANQVLGPNHFHTLDYKGTLIGVEGCLGNWTNCAELGRQMLHTSGEGVDGALYEAALCSLVVGNATLYHEFSSRLAELAIDSTNVVPQLADVLCDAVPELSDTGKALETADRALKLQPNEYTRIPKGIIQYRRGNYREALKWLEDRSHHNDLLAAQASFFVAMAHWKLGNTNACAEALTRAHEKLRPATERGYLWQSWHELPRAILAQREAEALIFGTNTMHEIDSDALTKAQEQWRPLKRHIDKGTELGAQTRWADARNEFMAVVRSPQFDLSALVDYDYEVPARVAASILAAKDETAYQELRRRWLEWCKANRDIPGDLIKACFLPAPSGNAAEAELFCQTFPYKPAEFDSYLATLLLSFRAEDFKRVLELRAPGPREDASISDRRVKVATAQVFRAMALAKTGKVSDGLKLLQQVEKTMAPYLEHYEGDLWWDIVFGKIALDEAHAMFAQASQGR